MIVRDALTWAGPLVTLGVLAGLITRRRIGVCTTFAGYLMATAVADLLVALWPGSFYRQSFWLGKELVIAVFRFGMALELTYRTFRAFPGARATARGVLLLMSLLTLVAVLAGMQDLAPSPGATPLAPLISRVQPRLINGTIWLLTAVAAVVLWYRVPVHPLHKAILAGYVPYLLVFTTALSLIESQGWTARVAADYANGIAYLLLLVYWTVAAWRKDEVPVQAAEPARALETVTG